jgi:hypothetical protein
MSQEEVPPTWTQWDISSKGWDLEFFFRAWLYMHEAHSNPPKPSNHNQIVLT